MASMLIAISQTRTGNTRLFESSGLKWVCHIVWIRSTNLICSLIFKYVHWELSTHTKARTEEILRVDKHWQFCCLFASRGNQHSISIHWASTVGSKFANSRRIAQKGWTVHASDQGAGNGLEENIVVRGDVWWDSVSFLLQVLWDYDIASGFPCRHLVPQYL